MFVPDKCPRCKETAYWHEVDTHCTLFRVGWFKFQLLKNPRDEETWRCDHCGYEGTYDNHAEKLDRRC